MSDLYANPLVIKVQGGTQRSDVNLCRSCSAAHVVTLETGETRIRCNANHDAPIVLRHAVTQCSAYFDKTKPSIYQMQEIAWTLMTDKGGRKIGFAPPDHKDNHAPLPPSVGF